MLTHGATDQSGQMTSCIISSNTLSPVQNTPRLPLTCLRTHPNPHPHPHQHQHSTELKPHPHPSKPGTRSGGRRPCSSAQQRQGALAPDCCPHPHSAAQPRSIVGHPLHTCAYMRVCVCVCAFVCSVQCVYAFVYTFWCVTSTYVGTVYLP